MKTVGRIAYWLLALAMITAILISLGYSFPQALLISLVFCPCTLALEYLMPKANTLNDKVYISLATLTAAVLLILVVHRILWSPLMRSEVWYFLDVKPALVNPFFLGLLTTVLAIGDDRWGKLLSRKFPNKSHTITFVSDRKSVTVDVAEIAYIESNDTEVRIFTREGASYRNKTRISQWANLLGEGFIRIHRSYLVNSDKINDLSPDNITISGVRLPVSRKYRESVYKIMKKTVMLSVLLALMVISGCQSAEQQYVKKAVKLMDKHGLFAEGAAWDEARTAALAARPDSKEEAYDVVRQALKVAGGKHSFISTVERQQEAAAEDAETSPSVTQLEDGIVLIAIPEFSGQSRDENRRYARAVLDALSKTADVKGAVIDLRGNTGGNMYPMIAAVHRFLPDDAILKFKSRKFSQPITKSFILRSVGIEPEPQIDCPVALLTDDHTASSGEATLICFRGLEKARTFGTPTAGYASANAPYPMPDGSKLVLTTSCDVARTGEIFCDDPISPDVTTDKPLEEALGWLRNL